MSSINHPHDHFFRLVFAQPEHAADFLQNYLPREVAALLDFTTLEPLKDSFVDEALRETFADLLFSVRLREGGDVYIYVLIEHKSQPERDTAFQLLRYMVRIWERQRANQPEAPLRPIIPQVVYHGVARWSAPTTFGELFSGSESLRPFWPDFRFILQDVARMTDQDIVGLAMVQASLQIMKYVWGDEINLQLPLIMTMLHQATQAPEGYRYVVAALWYLTQSASKMNDETYAEALATAFGREGSELMTPIAEKWMEQGELRLATNVLVHRFGELPDVVRFRLESLNSEELESLMLFAGDAKSIEAVEAFLNGLAASRK